MKKYLLKKKKMIILSTLMTIIRQGLGVLGAAINAWALTALVKIDIQGFLRQEVYLMVVWTVIILIEGFLKVYNTKFYKKLILRFEQILLKDLIMGIMKHSIREVLALIYLGSIMILK